VSPFLLAGLAHSLQQLIRAGVDPGSHFVGEPQKPNASPKLRARVEDGEAAAHGQPPSGPAWWHFEHPFWIVRGPYIYPRCEPIHYQRVYEHFLAGGVVLHPRYPGPSILPRQWSHGEYRRVIRLSDDAVKLVEG
jgi:hypothetical protein